MKISEHGAVTSAIESLRALDSMTEKATDTNSTMNIGKFTIDLTADEVNAFLKSRRERLVAELKQMGVHEDDRADEAPKTQARPQSQASASGIPVDSSGRVVGSSNAPQTRGS